MSTPSDTPEQEHARKIRAAANTLNIAMREAWRSGLRVDLDYHYHQEHGVRHECPLVTPTIQRVEDL